MQACCRNVQRRGAGPRQHLLGIIPQRQYLCAEPSNVTCCVDFEGSRRLGRDPTTAQLGRVNAASRRDPPSAPPFPPALEPLPLRASVQLWGFAPAVEI